MTSTQLKFVELDKKKALFKEFMAQYAEAVKELALEMGVGSHFQDFEGTVYQIVECEGKFVNFDRYEIKRTRRQGERAGSLALKAAQELGYEVK